MAPERQKTMSAIPCENCGTPLEQHAEKCPKCEKSLSFCRTCKTPLVYSKYVQTKEEGTRWVTTEERYGFWKNREEVVADEDRITRKFIYTPCPVCGNPKPFMRLKITFRDRILYGGLKLVILLASFAVFVIVALIVFILWDSVLYQQLNQIKPFFLAEIGIALVQIFVPFFGGVFIYKLIGSLLPRKVRNRRKDIADKSTVTLGKDSETYKHSRWESK